MNVIFTKLWMLLLVFHMFSPHAHLWIQCNTVSLRQVLRWSYVEIIVLQHARRWILQCANLWRHSSTASVSSDSSQHTHLASEHKITCGGKVGGATVVALNSKINPKLYFKWRSMRNYHEAAALCAFKIPPSGLQLPHFIRRWAEHFKLVPCPAG